MDTNATIITAAVQIRAVWGGTDAVEVGVLTLKREKKNMNDQTKQKKEFVCSFHLLRGLSGLFLSRWLMLPDGDMMCSPCQRQPSC